MVTRVYAIEERGDVHELSDEKFIEIAEDSGHVWSLEGFQNFLNCEGSQEGVSTKTREYFFHLYYRFIDLENVPQEYK